MLSSQPRHAHFQKPYLKINIRLAAHVQTHFTICGQDAHKNTPTSVHEATNYLLKGRVWDCIGAEQFISRLSSSPHHPMLSLSTPTPTPHPSHS